MDAQTKDQLDRFVMAVNADPALPQECRGNVRYRQTGEDGWHLVYVDYKHDDGATRAKLAMLHNVHLTGVRVGAEFDRRVQEAIQRAAEVHYEKLILAIDNAPRSE